MFASWGKHYGVGGGKTNLCDNYFVHFLWSLKILFYGVMEKYYLRKIKKLERDDLGRFTQ